MVVTSVIKSQLMERTVYGYSLPFMYRQIMLVRMQLKNKQVRLHITDFEIHWQLLVTKTKFTLSQVQHKQCMQ